MVVLGDAGEEGEIGGLLGLGDAEDFLHLLGQLVDAGVVKVEFYGFRYQVDLFQGEVGGLRIGGLVVVAQMGELVEADLYLAVAVDADDECAGGEVAEALAVARDENDDDAAEARQRAVDEKQQPAEQVGSEGRGGAVLHHHTELHEALPDGLPVVEDLAEGTVQQYGQRDEEYGEDDVGLLVECQQQEGVCELEDPVDQLGCHALADAGGCLADLHVLAGDDV